MKEALVIGSHSFLYPGSKVGIQFIAEGLSRNGYRVHYLSLPSSPADLFSRTKRRRFNQSWIKRFDTKPQPIAENLYEYVLRTPYPMNNKYWHFYWQIKYFNLLRPRWLLSKIFNLTIHETSPTFIFLQGVRSRCNVLRLSDKPEGFSFHMPASVIALFVKRIRTAAYDEIWSVSEGLTAYIKNINPNVPVVTIRNGVDLSIFNNYQKQPNGEMRAVYVGSIDKWIDLDLLQATAALLPHWRFDLFGPNSTNSNITGSNIYYHGPIAYNNLPNIFNRCSVGLIPYKDISDRMNVVEQPVKFYAYLAAGLGIASTDVGGLKLGMSHWARYGNTPKEYADAIVASAYDAKQRSNNEIRLFLKDYSWDLIINRIMERLHSIERS
ncbi:MAG: hypothetical protein JXB48_20875 [Candidatus Latescibacteria bacterium]|nr:hypothetical protein [Candidatus Latescibacterota bacterium]